MSSKSISHFRSFNWATDFSPWKAAMSLANSVAFQGSLQLGHGFFSVERARIESNLQSHIFKEHSYS
jgi:hypothetical protein